MHEFLNGRHHFVRTNASQYDHSLETADIFIRLGER